MSFQGHFISHDNGKVKIRNEKGEWNLYAGKGCETIATLPLGTPITFEASKPEGKNYWRMTSYSSLGQQPSMGTPAHPPFVPPPMVEQGDPMYAQPTQPQPIAATRQVSDQECMFVVGVVGRAMGSGNFSAQDIPLLTTAAVAAFRAWQAPEEVPF